MLISDAPYNMQTASCPPQYVFIPVQYSVEFPSSKCQPANGTNHPSSFPITVAIPAGGTALDVMHGAVDIDRRYQFNAKSFGQTLGFSIIEIAGTASSDNCYWSFYVAQDGSPAKPSNVGVSHFSICSPAVSISMRYSSLSCDNDSCL